MKAKEKDVLKSHSLAELRSELAQSRDKHFRLRFKNGVSPLSNPMEIRSLRRHIARLETWVREKEAGAAAAPAQSAARPAGKPASARAAGSAAKARG